MYNISVLDSEPPGVGLAEQWASNLIPVGLGIVCRWHSKVRSRATDRPSSLGDPDGLSICCGLCDIEGIIKEGYSAIDAIGLCGLVVWVSVHSDPVASLNDGRIRSIDPSSPCVDVTDENFTQRSTGNGRSNLTDI